MDPKAGTGIVGPVELNRSTHGCDESPRNREPKPASLGGPAPLIRSLHERLEEVLEHVLVHARPGVLYDDRDLVAFVLCSETYGSAFRSELEGVADQVIEDAL